VEYLVMTLLHTRLSLPVKDYSENTASFGEVAAGVLWHFFGSQLPLALFRRHPVKPCREASRVSKDCIHLFHGTTLCCNVIMHYAKGRKYSKS